MRRWWVSAKLMPARATPISTSPAPGLGRGDLDELEHLRAAELALPGSRASAARRATGARAAAYLAPPMSLTVVGSIAYDAVKTPVGERERMLGGAATHFALAASFFDEVRVIGPVGDDFDEESWEILGTRGTITDDVERVAGGKTFFWRGEYHDNLNTRETLDDRAQRLRALRAEALATRRAACDVLFLANIQPDLQRAVREQCRDGALRRDGLDGPVDQHRARLARRDDPRRRLPAAQRRGARDARRASRTSSAPRGRSSSWGPSAVVAKQGKYGAALFTERGLLRAARLSARARRRPDRRRRHVRRRLRRLVAAHRASDVDHEALVRAMVYGTALASFNVEEFGTERMVGLTAGRDRRARRATCSA